MRKIHTKGHLGPSWTPAQQSSPEASPGRLAQPQGLAGDNRKVPTGQAPAGLLPGTLWVSGLERSVSETVCPRRRQTGRGLQISFTGIKKLNAKKEGEKRKNPSCCRITQLKFHA